MNELAPGTLAYLAPVLSLLEENWSEKTWYAPNFMLQRTSCMY